MNQQNIPKLRFKGFEGEWIEERLKKITNLISGYAFKSEYFSNAGKKLITPKNFTKYGELNFDIGNTKHTTECCDQKYYCKNGDLLVLLTDLTPSCELLGKPALIKNENEEILLNQRIVKVNTDELNLNKNFLLYFLLRDEWHKRVKETASGTTVRHSSNKIIQDTQILYPSLQEQQKIASFLGKADELVNNLKQQKENLEKYKKGMMQKIFAQEIRFKDENGKEFEEWKELKLGSLCNYRNGDSFETNVVDNGKYNLITLNSIDITGNLKNKHKTVDCANWYLEKDDLIMVLSDVAHGDFLGLVDIIPCDDKYVLNQRMGLLRVKNSSNDVFFLKLLINKNQKYFKLYGQGSSQKNLSKGDILNFKIKLPELKEQQKIAEFFTSIDKIIDSKQEQIAEAEKWKKGLMQGLFV